jgi:orotidine-5'-phosphate decarboxylase
VLTSIDGPTLKQTGVDADVLQQVLRLADLTQSAGLDGVVASPGETPHIRHRCGPEFTIVTPGIRGGAATRGSKDDQERTMGPAEAIAAGASYIVVGRPIIAAPDPRAAAEAIADEANRAVVRGS